MILISVSITTNTVCLHLRSSIAPDFFATDLRGKGEDFPANPPRTNFERAWNAGEFPYASQRIIIRGPANEGEYLPSGGGRYCDT